MTLMNHWQEKYPTVPVSRKKLPVRINVYPKNTQAAIHCKCGKKGIRQLNEIKLREEIRKMR